MARERRISWPQVLAALLLSTPLDDLPRAHPAVDLLRADGVVAVEPARVSYVVQSRLPAELADALASLQARRLMRALPEPPAVAAVFDPRAYPLARALLAEGACELWYAPPPQTAPTGSVRLERRVQELDLQARERSVLTFAPEDDRAPLWARLRELGVDVRVSATAASRYAR
jgi:hypothetical protein